MKKTFKLFVAVFATVVTVSCAKEITTPETDKTSQEPQASKLIAVSFNVTSDDETKAVLGEDGKSVMFRLSDKIAVWDGTAKQEFTVSSVNGKNAIIEGNITEETEKIYVVSPYDAFDSVGDSKVNIVIPSEQNPPVGGVDPKALVQAAIVSDFDPENPGTIELKNLVSLAKFTLGEGSNVESVTLQGKNGETFCGDASVAEGDFPASISASATGASKVVLTPAGGGSSNTFSAGTYYAAIAPVTFEKGVIVEILKSDDKLNILSSSSSFTFARNGGKNLGNILNSKTVTLPFTEIATAEQLDIFGRYISYWNESETNVSITADIDFNNIKWTPIETLDVDIAGGDHSIKNFVVETDSNACFANTVNGSVSNLTFGAAENDNSLFKTTSKEETCLVAPFGIVNGSLSNITNYASVQYAGAITGTDADNGFNMGGICGKYSSNALSGCKNYGTLGISGSGHFLCGGIAGVIASSEATSVTGCENHGQITVNKKFNATATKLYIGGIAGDWTSENNVACTVSDCVNDAAIIVETNSWGGRTHCMGGLLARVEDKVNVTISGCSNTGNGDISSDARCTWAFMGGLVGYVEQATIGSETASCSNAGDVSFTASSSLGSSNDNPVINLGGIAGRCTAGSTTPSTIAYCTNSGAVSNSAYVSTDGNRIAVGGVAGNVKNVTLSNCNNSGTVSEAAEKYTKDASDIYPASYVGGIAGLNDDGTSVFTDNSNTGAVSMTGDKRMSYIAGVLALSNGAITTFKNNDNSGNITQNISIKHYMDGTTETSYNAIAAGILGSIPSSTAISTFSDCDNSGSITCTYSTWFANGYFGGVIAHSSKALTMDNCSSTGDITSKVPSGIKKMYIGGLWGCSTGNCVIKDSYVCGTVIGQYTNNSYSAKYAGITVGRIYPDTDGAFSLQNTKVRGKVNNKAITETNCFADQSYSTSYTVLYGYNDKTSTGLIAGINFDNNCGYWSNYPNK